MQGSYDYQFVYKKNGAQKFNLPRIRDSKKRRHHSNQGPSDFLSHLLPLYYLEKLDDKLEQTSGFRKRSRSHERPMSLHYLRFAVFHTQCQEIPTGGMSIVFMLQIMKKRITEMI